VVRLLPESLVAVLDVHGSVREPFDRFPDAPFAMLSYLKHRMLRKRWLPFYHAALVVTDYLARECRKMCPDLTTFTVPCASLHSPTWTGVIEHRKQWRSALGLRDEELVLVHCGGLRFHQRPEPMIALTEMLLRCGIPARLLIATHDRLAAEGAVRSAPGGVRDRILIRSVPNGQHLEALAAGDLGLLLREDIPTNRAAFPNKADEYWAAGLPVVTSPGLQAVADIVRDEPQAGVIVDYPGNSAAPASQTLWFRQLSQAGLSQRNARFSCLQNVRKRLAFHETLSPFVAWLRSQVWARGTEAAAVGR
jgi:hypothetical protein